MDPFYFLIALLFGAIILVVLGKAKDKEMEWFKQNGVRVQGTVVKNTFFWGRVSVVRSVVRFTTEHGEIIEALDENGAAMAIPKFAIGQKVFLIYDKSNPHNFRIITNGNFA
ncbi:MAG: hypothetical protein ACRYFR_14390 [Janthinobacterium lividum]